MYPISNIYITTIPLSKLVAPIPTAIIFGMGHFLHQNLNPKNLKQKFAVSDVSQLHPWLFPRWSLQECLQGGSHQRSEEEYWRPNLPYLFSWESNQMAMPVCSWFKDIASTLDFAPKLILTMATIFALRVVHTIPRPFLCSPISQNHSHLIAGQFCMLICLLQVRTIHV